MWLIHGDLKPEHILVDDDGRVAIVDFDLSVMADPMIDIAHFIAFLERSAARSRTGATGNTSSISVFLDEYFVHAPGDGLTRLRLYHAAAAVHKAAGLCRTPSAKNSSLAEQILDEGIRFASGELAATVAPSFKRRMTRTV
jgi:aminoglycoside phosphotransferase (APT) family kinase protein